MLDIPILSSEDELFLQRLAETAGIEGEDISEASVHQEELDSSSDQEPTPACASTKDAATKSRWSWLGKAGKNSKFRTASKGLHTVVTDAKGHLPSSSRTKKETGACMNDEETNLEEGEIESVLNQLNLAAVNNKVFSISHESQELLQRFTLVLKDLVNGVPTAYDDLEALLTNKDAQLRKSYSHLPSWVQKLVEQLPTKLNKSLGPELLATATAVGKSQSKLKVPTLKDITGKPGALIAMLKTILNFLKLRFPAFMGLNVLYSLAVFVLLFVLWYCYKRGKDVRLEQEQLALEEHIETISK